MVNSSGVTTTINKFMTLTYLNKKA